MEGISSFLPIIFYKYKQQSPKEDIEIFLSERARRNSIEILGELLGQTIGCFNAKLLQRV